MEIAFRSGSAEALWSQGIARVYLLGGEEDRLKAEALGAIVQRVVPDDFRDFDLETLDADAATADQIAAAAGQAPFGADRRLVVVKGLEKWRDRSRQSEADRLAAKIPLLPPSACVVLVTAAQEDEGRRKTVVSSKLDAAVKSGGALVVCAGLKGGALATWVRTAARELGHSISGAAVQQLIGAVGEDMGPLENELIKLVCYVGDRAEIGPDDVAAVVSANAEDVMFQTVDAITSRRTDKALLLLAEMHRHDPKAQGVAGRLISLLSRQYRMLWQAKFLAESRVHPRDVRALPPELADQLPNEGNIAQLAFKASDLFTQSRTYSWASIRAAIDLLLICDLANKGGVTDEIGIFGSDVGYNLQLLVMELAGAMGDPAALRVGAA